MYGRTHPSLPSSHYIDPDHYRRELDNFDKGDWSLYPVALKTWGGFVFISLGTPSTESLETLLGDTPETFSHWPLAELGLAHREVHSIACNWKVFWENFMECYHCPGIHPGLTAEEQARGMTFSTLLPSVYIVTHVDYVRSVQVMPVGPQQTELTVSWMADPDVLAAGNLDVGRLTGFGRQVVLEDARVCELNQQGLQCRVHQTGCLMPIENDVLDFHNWLRGRLE